MPYGPQPEALHIPRVQAAVLLAVAYHGPTTKYEIAKCARLRPNGDIAWFAGPGIDRGGSMRYPVVHNAMKVLKSYGVVKEVGRRKGQKGARTLIFDLTQKGVLFLVGFVPRLDWGRLAANSRGAAVRLLVALRWWKYFESKRLEHLIRAMYCEAGRGVIHYLADQGRRRLDDDEVYSTFAHEVRKVAVKNWPDYVRFTIANLLNKDLAELYTKTRREEVEHLRVSLAEAEKRLQIVQSLSEWIAGERDAGFGDDKIESTLMGWVTRGGTFPPITS